MLSVSSGEILSRDINFVDISSLVLC